MSVRDEKAFYIAEIILCKVNSVLHESRKSGSDELFALMVYLYSDLDKFEDVEVDMASLIKNWFT